MKTSLGVLMLLLFFSGCSKRIHSDFEANRYLHDVTYHVVNDSLQVYHKSLGDFDYTKNKRTLRKILKSTNLENVLVHGKTNLEPNYEYFLLVNANRDKLNKKKFEFTKDTIVNGSEYLLLGRGINDKFPVNDWTFIADSFVFGDEYKRDEVSLSNILKINAHNYTFYKSFNQISKYSESDKSEAWFKLQFQLTYLSMLGRSQWYDDLLEKWESKNSVNDTILATIRENSAMGNEQVTSHILKHTKSSNLVMFNESHFYPEHRLLLTKLLPSLKKQGFEYLALEALNSDSLLNQGIKPNLKTGFYTKEQNFYRLIRTAQKLGYKFVVYESESGNRELDQAKNLYSKTFARNEDCKVIVLAGISHITEKPDDQGRKWLAQIFKEKYNIDPLTFSQTHLKLYRNKIKSNLALLESQHLGNRFEGKTDYQIINNLDWAPLSGNFKYKNEYKETVQLALFENERSTLLPGYWDLIPDYSALVFQNKTLSLNLENKSYDLVIMDKEGKVRHKEKLSFHQ